MSEGIWAQDTLYDGCGTTKGCFGTPELCVESMSCDIVTTYLYITDLDAYQFELYGNVSDPTINYLAVGLSENGKMGEDSVVLCSTFNNEDHVDQYWTRGFPKSAKILDEPSLGILESTVAITDGAFYCSFVREAVTDIPNPYSEAITTFDLKANLYHLQVAAGPFDEAGLPKKHFEKRPSPEPIDLNEFSR